MTSPPFNPAGLPRHASPKAGRAIVTYGRSLMSLVIARSLHEQGVEVIGCDDVGLTVLSFSRHVADTFIHAAFATDEEAALVDFEAAVRRFAPDDDRPYVLMPAFRDVRIFARHRDRFEPLIRIAGPDWASIQMVDPKDQFARFLSEHNLPGPRTRIIPPGEYREAPPANVTAPLIGKPVDGVGGRGVEMLHTRGEVQAYLAKADPKAAVLLQEVIPGDDFCVSFVAVRGEPIGVVAYRNIAQFPRKAGAGAVRETVDARPFIAATCALLKATKWNGVAEIDFRWDGKQTSEPKMLEVNPRYWAGLFHSTASGVDFPYIAYSLAAGLPIFNPDEDAVKVGFRTRTPGAWILSAAQEVAESDPHLAKAAEAWANYRTSVSQGDLVAALRNLGESAARSARGAGAINTLREHLKLHANLPSELNSDDDPGVGLGVLFALSSLIRHGKLPPELKFVAPEPAIIGAHPPKPVAAKERRPVIGVTKPADGDWLSYQAIRFAIAMAGGKAVKITARAPRDPHSIDGLVFGGGADVFPERYQAEPKAGYRYDLPRDDMEASWADAALSHDIPVLGVCRGMQMLNVLVGGTLFGDLSRFNDRRYPMTFFKRIFYRVPIVVAPDSWLADAAEKRELDVNSIHSQAVDRLGVGFVAVAWEANGLIQAIEHSRGAFLIGVQFHPELLIHRRFARRIFRSLVAAARAHARQKSARTQPISGDLAKAGRQSPRPS